MLFQRKRTKTLLVLAQRRACQGFAAPPRVNTCALAPPRTVPTHIKGIEGAGREEAFNRGGPKKEGTKRAALSGWESSPCGQQTLRYERIFAWFHCRT